MQATASLTVHTKHDQCVDMDAAGHCMGYMMERPRLEETVGKAWSAPA